MTAASQPLGSQWDGLSPYLIASFWEVDNKGVAIKDSKGNFTIVNAPLSECSLDVSLGWTSPFEGAGAEKSAPSLLAMLESGAIQPLIDVAATGAKLTNSAAITNAVTDFKNAAKTIQGRTGVTKLNSIQVFTGMQPLKFSAVAVFRAWEDPIVEVENPVSQLMEWALPQKLAADTTLLSGVASMIIETAKGNGTAEGWLNAILPSIQPVMIAMQYKGRTFSPLVIEGISYPMGSPIDSNGNFVELALPITICSLAAWDKGDWLTSINPSPLRR